MRRHSNSLEGQLHWSYFHGQFCKGMTHVLFPIFPSSSFILEKKEKRRLNGTVKSEVVACFREHCEFCKMSQIYKIISLLKRVLRSCKHLPKSCSFWKPGIHGPVIFHLLPEKFPGSLETTTLLTASFLCVLWSTAASQQLFQYQSMPLSQINLFMYLFPMLSFWIPLNKYRKLEFIFSQALPGDVI